MLIKSFDYTIAEFVFEQTLVSTVGINDAQSAQLTAYPNPATDVLTIDMTSIPEDNYEIKLLDLSGKIIMKDMVSDLTKHNINISDLSQGIYVLSVSNGENAYQRKIIIQ